MKTLSRLLTLVLVLCLCLTMIVPASAASIPDPGEIFLSIRSARQPNGSSRVTYTAQMVMLEELAEAATFYRTDARMADLRFICTLEDEMVRQIPAADEDDFTFISAQYQGRDIFLYEYANKTATGLRITYKLNPSVLTLWKNARADEVKASLMQPMTMKTTKIVPASVARAFTNGFVSTAKVEVEGTGIQLYFGQYSVIGAEGRFIYSNYRPGGGHGDTPAGTLTCDHGYIYGQCYLCDCPRNIFCPAGHLTDLNLQLWYHDGIHYCLEHGLMEGFPGSWFGPYEELTRAQVVMVLYRMEGEPTVSGKQIYDDVEPGQWYTEAIEWGTEAEVINGYGKKMFGPNDPVERQQMAAILWRYAKYKGYDVTDSASLQTYGDAADVHGYAVPAMEWACGAGLINGISGNLKPVAKTERCQAAAIFQRFCMHIDW